MSGRDEHDEILAPEQEAQLRRLLADARHTDPMPSDVVARLDRVLAGLADEPARAAKVVRLADRRRRATRLLVAAAAVVAVGFGGSQVVDGFDGFSGAGDASSPAAEAGQDEDAAEGAEAPGPTSGELEPQSPADRRRLAKVRAQAFADDTAELRDGIATYEYSFVDGELTEDQADLARAVCSAGAWGAGRYVAVRYAGDPGWIVFRRPQGDTQVADLFLCGSELARRSLTLPYP